jgi:lysozyme
VINAAGLALIKRFEGCRLEAYQDSVGVWTIGYGHTTAAGSPSVVPGMKITQDQAESILIKDLSIYASYVDRYVKVKISDNARAACISFCYNVGPANFAKSSLLKSINNGNMDDAARRFLLWNKAGGKVLPGLTRRRAAEAALFLSPDAGASETADISPESTTMPDEPSGKPMMASTTNLAAGGASLASVAGGAAAVSDLAASAAGTASSVRTIWDTLGTIAPIIASVVVVICAGWIVYQRLLKSKEDGV